MSEVAQKGKKHNSLPVLTQPTLIEEGPESPTRSPASSDLQLIRFVRENLQKLPYFSLSRAESIESQPSTPGEDPGPFPSTETIPPRRSQFILFYLLQKVFAEVLRADREKAIWLPDGGTSKCLMEGCGTVFALLIRRHHCRSCGYVSPPLIPFIFLFQIMCWKCSGRAPVPKCDFKKNRVCPECYDQIMDQCKFTVSIRIKNEYRFERESVPGACSGEGIGWQLEGEAAQGKGTQGQSTSRSRISKREPSEL